jgi:hypothetical protein
MWTPTHAGTTIGKIGSEGGTILRDDEQPDGSRITLERDGHAPWSITCGILGVMVHTCFFSTEEQATTAYQDMQAAIERLTEALSQRPPSETASPSRVAPNPVAAFIERFP